MGLRNSIFHFKQFTIDHSAATMKVGTDAVLLGAWVHVGNRKRILDIGTGSGVIALMLAQRTDKDAHVDAVELIARDAEQARENIRNSPWPNKVVVHQSPIQEFQSAETYDCIVSNPPFFTDSFEPPDSNRIIARHTSSLPFRELLHAVARLLSDEGSFSIILPFSEGQILLSMALTLTLRLTRQCTFRGRADKKPERLLLEFKKQYEMCEVDNVVMYSDNEEYSDAYKELTKDFYLKF